MFMQPILALDNEDAVAEVRQLQDEELTGESPRRKQILLHKFIFLFYHLYCISDDQGVLINDVFVIDRVCYSVLPSGFGHGC